MVGDGVVVGAERHRHADAVPRRRGDIDVLVAHAHSGHDPEAGGGGEHALAVGLEAGDGGGEFSEGQVASLPSEARDAARGFI